MEKVIVLLTDFIKKVEDKYATKEQIEVVKLDVKNKYDAHSSKFRLINKFFFVVFSTIVGAIVVAISQAL
jgi:hypothetical protein